MRRDAVGTKAGEPGASSDGGVLSLAGLLRTVLGVIARLRGNRRDGARERRAETVEAALEIVGTVDDEARVTGRHLDTKTGSLIGVAAVVLTLNATLGRPILAADLEGAWDTIASVSFMGSIAALLVAIAAGMFGVLVPKQQQSAQVAFIEKLAEDAILNEPADALREGWLQAQTRITVSDRHANRSRVFWMRVSAIALGVGLLAVAGQAVTLGVAT